MKRNIFITTILLSIISIASANNYVWLHGMNDAYNCWKIYDEAFTPGISDRFYYVCDTSISVIASRRNYNYTTSRYETMYGKKDMILIGHSMGGIVAREIEYNHRSNVKGIITIGTPHEGAMVLNELNNGGANLLSKKVIKKAKNSVQASIAAISSIIFGFSNSNFLNGLISSSLIVGLDVADYLLMPTVEQSIEDQKKGMNINSKGIQDMVKGSPYMQTIASRKVNVPILTFACEEDRWALARTGYCASTKTSPDKPLSNKYRLQTEPTLNSAGNFDMGGYNQLKDINNTCYIIGGGHAVLATAAFALGFTYPKFFYTATMNGIASGFWFDAALYIDNGLDYDNAVLVGAYHDEIKEIKFKLFGKWYVIPISRIRVPEPHDGIVPVNSQLLPYERGTRVIHANTTIKGVNHMEQFNHPKTRAEFKKAIEDGAYAPETFQKK